MTVGRSKRRSFLTLTFIIQLKHVVVIVIIILKNKTLARLFALTSKLGQYPIVALSIVRPSTAIGTLSTDDEDVNENVRKQ